MKKLVDIVVAPPLFFAGCGVLAVEAFKMGYIRRKKKHREEEEAEQRLEEMVWKDTTFYLWDGEDIEAIEIKVQQVADADVNDVLEVCLEVIEHVSTEGC